MAKTIDKDKKIFADKIRMIAKSIYDAADDIAGGTSMKIAAEMWNNSIVNYCRMKMEGVVRLPYMEKDSHVEKKPQAANAENSADDPVIHVKEADICKS